MSQYFKSRKEFLQNQLDKVNYAEAINFYKIKETLFRKQYLEAAQQINREGAEEDIDEVIKNINKAGFRETSYVLADSLIAKIEDIFKNFFEKDTNDFVSFIKDEESSYSKMKKNAKEELIQAINNKYNMENIKDLVENTLNEKQLFINGTSIDDLVSWAKSVLYARVFYNSKKEAFWKDGKFNNQSFQNSRRSVGAGYFEEALVHKAFSKLGQNLNKKVNIMTGSNKKANKGKDSIFDEYLNFLNILDINEIFNISIDSESSTILKEGFGIQSKVWENISKLSKDYKKTVKSRHITNNATLLQKLKRLEYQHSWILGIVFLEKNYREALGDNVGYQLGNHFFWTYEMIEDFHKEKFYLAFHFNEENYEATSSINWEKQQNKT